MTETLEPQPKPETVRDAIEMRRSIRDYDPAPIPEADIKEILRLAGLAPSSGNLQPWRFVVVTNPDLKARVREAAFNQRQFASAPAVIAVVADGEDMLARLEETAHPNMASDPAALERYVGGTRNRLSKQSEAERATWAVSQAFIAVGYLTLAAQSLGYATSVMGGFEEAKVKDLLDVPSYARIAALVTLGKPLEEGFSHHRHPLEITTRWKR